jgi:hypothetical protein
MAVGKVLALESCLLAAFGTSEELVHQVAYTSWAVVGGVLVVILDGSSLAHPA